MFSALFHLHTNIYQHSWKWLVINPYHYVNDYILCIYAGVDGLDLVLKGRQLLHKHMKCKHQHSGRGLLLTISTSVGKYLYAGEIRVKTHFKSMETHSTDQGKMRNQSENTSQAQLDQNKPMHLSKPA